MLPHFFDSSPHLSEILLARNRLSRVNDGTFGLLTRLALLDLSRNSLMRLEDNVLVGMTVVHLDLGGNSIDILDLGQLYGRIFGAILGQLFELAVGPIFKVY